MSQYNAIFRKNNIFINQLLSLIMIVNSVRIMILCFTPPPPYISPVVIWENWKNVNALSWWTVAGEDSGDILIDSLIKFLV